MATTSQPPQPASTAGVFDQSHSGRMRSAAVEAIYRDAFGEDYPAAAQPSAFYSAATLRSAVDRLDLRPGRVLADLGAATAARPGPPSRPAPTLIGIDLSPAGIDLARRRAAQLGLAARARFTAGDLAATGLPDASCDAVISLDVLPFVPGKAAALARWHASCAPAAGSPSPPGNSSPIQPLARTTTPSARRCGHLRRPPPAAIRPHRLPRAHRAGRADRRDIPRTTRLAAPAAGARRRHHRRRTTGHQRHGPPLPSHGRVFLTNLPNVRYILAVARRPAITDR